MIMILIVSAFLDRPILLNGNKGVYMLKCHSRTTLKWNKACVVEWLVVSKSCFITSQGHLCFFMILKSFNSKNIWWGNTFNLISTKYSDKTPILQWFLSHINSKKSLSSLHRNLRYSYHIILHIKLHHPVAFISTTCNSTTQYYNLKMPRSFVATPHCTVTYSIVISN